MKRMELLEAFEKPKDVPNIGKLKINLDYYDDSEFRHHVRALTKNENIMAQVQKIANFIKKNAQPYLSQINPKRFILYRGLDYTMKPVFIQGMPKDRKPKDTERFRHDSFNAMIAAVGGYANRSNSIFATRSEDQASSYGDVYAVIPLGNFRYTYAPRWYDWTEDAPEGLDTYLEILNDRAISEILVQAKKKRFFDDEFIRNYYSSSKIAKIDITNLKHIAANRTYLSWFLLDVMGDTDPSIEHILKNPKSYDAQALKNYIRVDRGLGSLNVEMEIMISASKVLCVEQLLYQYLVAPYLIRTPKKS